MVELESLVSACFRQRNWFVLCVGSREQQCCVRAAENNRVVCGQQRILYGAVEHCQYKMYGTPRVPHRTGAKTHRHARTHTHTHTRTRAGTHARAHTHTHTHTHTHRRLADTLRVVRKKMTPVALLDYYYGHLDG